MHSTFRLLPVALAATGFLAACGTAPGTSNEANLAPSMDARLQDDIKTVVVIYAENRSFDNLFGLFPGADGIPGLNPSAVGPLVLQTDRGPAGTPSPDCPRPGAAPPPPARRSPWPRAAPPTRPTSPSRSTRPRATRAPA